MTRVVGAGIAAALLVALTPPARADEIVQIRRVELARFPEIALTVAFAEGEVDPESVSVSENEAAVEVLGVESLQSTGNDINVVLAIDTSGSMIGTPIESAKEAASDFIRGLPDNVNVGIVTFADIADVAHPITGNRQRALGVIETLEVAGETALFDGVARAAAMFKGRQLRNIVLLSDGVDTVSSTTFAAALASVRRSRAVVYSVGLESGDFDETALKRLARGTDGRYSTADTARLAALYSGLAEEIANQYVVTYESNAPPGAQLEIELVAGDGGDVTLALAPEIVSTKKPAVPQPQRVPEADPLLAGVAGLIVVAVLVFATFFMILLTVLGASARKRRDESLARRMAASGVASESDDEAGRGAVDWIPDPFLQLGERAAGVGKLNVTVDARLERAGIEIRTAEFLAASLLTALLGMVLGSLLLPRPLFVILLTAVFGMLPWGFVTFRATRRMKTLHEQLVDILMILASSLRAGHSFLQAIDAVSREVGEPGAREFSRLVAEIRLGRDVDEALFALADRIDSEDFRWAVIAVSIQRNVGGNLAEVLDTVAETIRDRQNIRRQIDVLSAEGKLSIYVLAGLPILLTIYMAIVNPTYIGLLFSTRIGLVMLVVAASLITLGVLWMRKVVRIDV